MKLGEDNGSGRAVGIPEVKNEHDTATVPKVFGQKLIAPDSMMDFGFMRAGRSKVKMSDKDIEIERSNLKFREMALNGISAYMLSSEGQIVKTNSKQVGEGEYVFVKVKTQVRIWRGGISVFDDGDLSILWHRPHILIDTASDEFQIGVITDIHAFDLVSLFAILKNVGVIGNADEESA